MDIARTPKKKRGKYIAIGAGVVAFVLLTLVLVSLPTAAPSVERSTLLIDSVQRGTMVRAVRAPGTLVPEQIQLVSALTAGRVEKIEVRPGATVDAGSRRRLISSAAAARPSGDQSGSWWSCSCTPVNVAFTGRRR